MAIKGHIPVFYNGEYHTFYPKTLLSQVITPDGKTLETVINGINTGSNITDPNLTNSNGIYNISNSDIMPSTGKYIIDVSVYDQDNIYQTAISVDTGETYIRWKKDGVWTNWEEYSAGNSVITFDKEEIQTTYQQSWGRTIPIPKEGFDPNINKFIIIIGSVVIVSRRYTIEGTNVILNEDEDLLEDGRTIDFIFFSTGMGGSSSIGSSTSYNENILINGDFQIWQRGTSFKNIDTNKYCADRWLHIKDTPDSVINIDKVDNGIHLDSTASTNIHHLIQLLPETFSTKHVNDTFTLTVKVSNFENTTSLSLNGNEFISNGVQTKGSDGIYSITSTISKYSSKENLYISIDGSHIDVCIEWVKLEFGSMYTGFVSNSYEDEFKNCLQYYENIEYNEYPRPYVVFSKNDIYVVKLDFKEIKNNIPLITINNNDTSSQYSDDSNTVNITDKHIDKYGVILVIDKNLDAISINKYTVDSEIYV